MPMPSCGLLPKLHEGGYSIGGQALVMALQLVEASGCADGVCADARARIADGELSPDVRGSRRKDVHDHGTGARPHLTVPGATVYRYELRHPSGRGMTACVDARVAVYG